MADSPVTSEVVRSALIVHFAIESSVLGDWEPQPGRMLLRRTGTLELRVIAVLKGQLVIGPGQVATVPIVQEGTGTGAVRDYYGLWSHVPVSPGTELVAFCDAQTDLAVALTEEHCEQLVDPARVLPDVQLALGLAASRMVADALLAEAARLRSTGGAVFARFIWDRVRNAVVGSPDRFAALMRIAEDPATRTDAQEVYLQAAYEDATFTESLDADQRARLARAMFRTALDPAQGELRDQLLTTFLPNLVQAPVPEPLSSAEVFDQRQELADSVRADEADENTSQYGEPLSRWLSDEGAG
jgi:hypothetical protein